jgi:short-subunit dehydrogenase
MKEFRGKVAAITGAASGIGLATAIRLAEEGCHLAIADLNASALQDARQQLDRYGVKISCHELDVANKAAVYQFADDVVAAHGKVNIIMNNAGVGLGETIENINYDNFEWLMNINFWGVVYGTCAFLPYLKQSGEGHVINISSVFGLIGVPTQAAYNSAKFAVRGFTECLRQELEIDPCGVSASCVHPGGIKTNIARSSRTGGMGRINPGDKQEIAQTFERLARTTAEETAKVIVEGVRKNKRRILVGLDAKVIDGVQRLMPTSYQRLLEFGTKRTVVQ